MRHAIGIDMGGSSAKLAIVAENGRMLWSEIVTMPDKGGPRDILAPLAAALAHVQARARAGGLEVAALGCAVTAYLDAHGDALDLCNIRALDGFAFTTWLRDQVTLPLVVDNDACLAALGEARAGDQGSEERILYVTIGSGIGVVLLVSGAIVRIMHGVTGDAGHILVHPAGTRRCLSGCRGCLESVAAAPAIAWAGRAAAEQGASAVLAAVLREQGKLTGADVAAAGCSGDEAARAILQEAGTWLGAGLASWAAIYEPDVILLGGGVADAGDAWLDSALAAFHDLSMPILSRKTAVRRAALGRQAGVVGAALIALESMEAGHTSPRRTMGTPLPAPHI